MLASAGWWVLSAPAIEREPLAPPLDIDIDPPGMRAARDAALALATMPDDPWTFAESMAASAPTSVRAKEHCGIEERPEFIERTPGSGLAVADQVRAAGPGYASAQSRLDAALRASADPFDHAVADFLNVGAMRTPAGRVDALAQQALGTTDPRVYALAYELCRRARQAGSSCAGLSAGRWTELEPDNGIAWLQMLDEARARGDAAGQQQALAGLASAARFDQRVHAAAGAVAARLPGAPEDLAGVSDLANFAWSEMDAQETSSAALFQICGPEARGHADVATQCKAIGERMFEHADNLMLRAEGGLLLSEATGDPSRHQIALAEQQAFASHWSQATGFSECRAERDKVRALLRNAQLGELEAARERSRAFVTP